jgi:hypothetical protein
MDQQLPNYRREFFRSKHHAWLGVTTLGLGFVLGASLPIFLLGGAAAYALGWIYLPDMAFFKRYVDGQRDAARQAAAAAELAGFQQKRDALHASLTPRLRARYNELSEVCHQIEHATADDAMSHSGTTDPRLSRLDDLMWTYLRLLSLDNSLERFLEIERREDVPGRIRDAEAVVGSLGSELESLKKQGAKVATTDAKESLLQSRLEALEVLRKRQARCEEAATKLALVHSEQERLESQIKLLRAEAAASKNTSSISARIDTAVENLDQTNKWLTEINEFKDSVGQIPATEMRVGYRTRSVPPPIPAQSERAKQNAPEGGR